MLQSCLTPGPRGCSARCFASGYYCPAGTSNLTGLMCGPGQYSVPRQPTCLYCPAGTLYLCMLLFHQHDTAQQQVHTHTHAGLRAFAGYFGQTSGLKSSFCSGSCLAGYACVVGSNSSTQAMCLPGYYSPSASSTCLPCAEGRYGSSPAQTTSDCVGACPAGKQALPW
jgi:hypothetical protein